MCGHTNNGIYIFEEQTGVYIGTTTFSFVLSTILGTICKILYRLITLFSSFMERDSGMSRWGWRVSIVKKNVPAPILGTHTNNRKNKHKNEPFQS